MTESGEQMNYELCTPEQIAADKGLTVRHVRILDCLSYGMTNRAIAVRITTANDRVTEAAVKNELKKIYKYLGAIDRAHAVRIGLEIGLLTNSDGGRVYGAKVIQPYMSQPDVLLPATYDNYVQALFESWPSDSSEAIIQTLFDGWPSDRGEQIKRLRALLHPVTEDVPQPDVPQPDVPQSNTWPPIEHPQGPQPATTVVLIPPTQRQFSDRHIAACFAAEACWCRTTPQPPERKVNQPTRVPKFTKRPSHAD